MARIAPNADYRLFSVWTKMFTIPQGSGATLDVDPNFQFPSMALPTERARTRIMPRQFEIRFVRRAGLKFCRVRQILAPSTSWLHIASHDSGRLWPVNLAIVAISYFGLCGETVSIPQHRVTTFCERHQHQYRAKPREPSGANWSFY